MIVRRYHAGDTEAIARLFHDTIHRVNCRDYTPAQVAAWAPADVHFRDWAARCSSRYTFVVEEDGVLLGYGNLETNGHLDHLYVHHLHQGRGVGRRLCAAIETEAQRLGLRRLFTEASITARPFFARLGYATLREQTVHCRGQDFVNYIMEKYL